MTQTVLGILGISPAAYQEIRDALEACGYADKILHAGTDAEVINMHGLALSMTPDERCRICTATLVQCGHCGAKWCLDHQPHPLVCPGCGARPSVNIGP